MTAALLAAIRDTFLREQLDPLERVAAEVVALAAAGPLTESSLAALTPVLDMELGQSDVYVGAGFVAAPGVVKGRDLHLHWIQINDGRTAQIRLNLDLKDFDVYDYVEMEWFVGARETGGPVIYGPYLDYSGSNRFVFTLAVPVIVDSFVGVVGADLLADRVEISLGRLLLGLSGPAAVITPEGTVIASNAPQWIPGETLSLDRPGSGDVGVIDAWCGWRLVVDETTS